MNKNAAARAAALSALTIPLLLAAVGAAPAWAQPSSSAASTGAAAPAAATSSPLSASAAAGASSAATAASATATPEASTPPASAATPPATSTKNSALSSSLAPSSSAPASPALPASASGMMQVVTGLAVVLALMAGVAWLLKRLNIAKTGSASAIRIIGGVSVGNRERVMVVEVAEQWIVVGVAAGSVTSLATMPRQVAAGKGATLDVNGLPVAGSSAAGSAGAANFSSWLKQKIDQRNART